MRRHSHAVAVAAALLFLSSTPAQPPLAGPLAPPVASPVPYQELPPLPLPPGQPGPALGAPGLPYPPLGVPGLPPGTPGLPFQPGFPGPLQEPFPDQGPFDHHHHHPVIGERECGCYHVCPPYYSPYHVRPLVLPAVAGSCVRSALAKCGITLEPAPAKDEKAPEEDKDKQKENKDKQKDVDKEKNNEAEKEKK